MNAPNSTTVSMTVRADRERASPDIIIAETLKREVRSEGDATVQRLVAQFVTRRSWIGQLRSVMEVCGSHAASAQALSPLCMGNNRRMAIYDKMRDAELLVS